MYFALNQICIHEQQTRVLTSAFVPVFPFTLCHRHPHDAGDQNRFPEVIDVALSLAPDEGGPWSTSVKQLLLTSSRICRACRGVPALRLTGDMDTPAYVLLGILDDDMQGRVKELQSVATVPPIEPQLVRFLHCRMPVDFVQCLVLDSLRTLLISDDANFSVEDVELPPLLKVLEYKGKFNRAIRKTNFPDGLEELVLGGKFNQRVDKVRWPESLSVLQFGERFNREVSGLSLPPSVKKLYFGSRFNQPVDGVTWAGVEKRTFGGNFNQPLDGVNWPGGLKKLTLGQGFNKAIGSASLPKSLRHLNLLRPGAQLPEYRGFVVSGVVETP